MVYKSTCKIRHQLHFSDLDVDGLTIVATSEEYTDFAFVMLTRDELALGLAGRKCHGITGSA